MPPTHTSTCSSADRELQAGVFQPVTAMVNKTVGKFAPAGEPPRVMKSRNNRTPAITTCLIGGRSRSTEAANSCGAGCLPRCLRACLRLAPDTPQYDQRTDTGTNQVLACSGALPRSQVFLLVVLTYYVIPLYYKQGAHPYIKPRLHLSNLANRTFVRRQTGPEIQNIATIG